MLKLDVLRFNLVSFILRLGLFSLCLFFLAILSLDVLIKKEYINIVVWNNVRKLI